ncbi:MAG: Nif3-like dinuclear metal center hexameric protein, partial [Clostridiales Family XIII bacterium]|nr:Nif3-like dinuclear metal center hexameric protein [Clostridiales Family XIII bacterium]
ELIRAIEQVAPPYLAAGWDNSGLQIEPAAAEIGRVLVALELTPDVVAEAKAGGYQLIIVHHPMFFGGGGGASRNILQSDPAGRFAWQLLAAPPAPVGVYAAHTAFDAAEGGLGDELQRLIGLTPWDDRLHPDIAAEFSDIAPYARTGRFREATDLAGAFARVRAALGTGADIRVSGDPARGVLKIMTVCGGGGDAIPLAVKTGCSLLITGDVRQHEWRLAEAEGLALIDAGHYYTERPFAKLFSDRLAEALGHAYTQIDIDVSTEIRQPYASPAQTKAE